MSVCTMYKGNMMFVNEAAVNMAYVFYISCVMNLLM